MGTTTTTATRTILAATAALAAAAAASAAGVPTLDVRARNGDPAPGGGTYAGFADVVLNDLGQIAFNADLAGDAPRGGLFLGETDGTAAAVARVGQQLPSGSTAQSLSRPALDNAGRVTLHAGVAYAGGGGGHELHRYDGGQLAAVAANGMTTADGRTVDTVDWRPAYAASESGRVVLLASLENPGVSGTLDAILLSGPGGNLEAVAVEGDMAPTVPGVPARTYGSRFTPDPSINDAGQVGFSSFSLSGGRGGTFRKSPGKAAQAILVPGQDVPSGESVFDATSPTSITADGRVLVQAALRPSPDQSDSSNFALYLGDGTSIEAIARDGQPVAGGTFGFGFFAFSTANRAGQAAFVAKVSDADRSDTYALFRGDDTDVVELAREGRAAPGGGTFLDSFGPTMYGPPAINDAGQVAFAARLAGEPAGKSLGIYFFDDRLGVVSVAVPGDVIDGVARRTLRLFPLGRVEGFSPTPAYRTDPLADGLNDLGQVAFTYESDSGGGVAVWTPPDVDDLLAGDANLDGVVTIADFAVLRANFGGGVAYFTTGDFDGDGAVSIADFALLRANFGGSVQEAAGLDAWAAGVVPEPAGLALLAAGGLGLARRR